VIAEHRRFVDDDQVDVGPFVNLVYKLVDAEPVVVHDVEVDVGFERCTALLAGAVGDRATPVHKRVEDVLFPDTLDGG
jgi:hypothetical protein